MAAMDASLLSDPSILTDSKKLDFLIHSFQSLNSQFLRLQTLLSDITSSLTKNDSRLDALEQQILNLKSKTSSTSTSSTQPCSFTIHSDSDSSQPSQSPAPKRPRNLSPAPSVSAPPARHASTRVVFGHGSTPSPFTQTPASASSSSPPVRKRLILRRFASPLDKTEATDQIKEMLSRILDDVPKNMSITIDGSFSHHAILHFPDHESASNLATRIRDETNLDDSCLYLSSAPEHRVYLSWVSYGADRLRERTIGSLLWNPRFHHFHCRSRPPHRPPPFRTNLHPTYMHPGYQSPRRFSTHLYSVPQRNRTIGTLCRRHRNHIRERPCFYQKLPVARSRCQSLPL